MESFHNLCFNSVSNWFIVTYIFEKLFIYFFILQETLQSYLFPTRPTQVLPGYPGVCTPDSFNNSKMEPNQDPQPPLPLLTARFNPRGVDPDPPGPRGAIPMVQLPPVHLSFKMAGYPRGYPCPRPTGCNPCSSPPATSTPCRGPLLLGVPPTLIRVQVRAH